MQFSPEWLSVPDATVAALLLPLSLWIAFSGLDDLLVDVMALVASLRARKESSHCRRSVLRADQAPIAVIIPCWKEHDVIEAMVTSNRQHVRYRNHQFFLGVYPNDEETLRVAEALEDRFPDVHVALCPHDGPTSKADCLNWIFQRILLFEAEREIRFEILVTHDAEDVIHPDALHWINYFGSDYDMVQVPVLPLPTPLFYWTHGVYCDEFSEYQTRDMPAREAMRSFLPSNGVGTGFRRSALEELACAESNRIFEPVCLTEDYENGLRLKLRGAKQVFVPAEAQGVATREYFPQSFRAAMRQRTRWITGISLQTWERHGWSGSLSCKYWLWRDRKGLVGNPVSLLTNLVCMYGFLSYLLAATAGTKWALEQTVQSLAPLLSLTSVLGAWRILYRAVCVSRNFGWRFSLGVPVRVVVANCINSAATFAALYHFFASKLRGEPLRWVKTEHQYPSAATLVGESRLTLEMLACYEDEANLYEVTSHP